MKHFLIFIGIYVYLLHLEHSQLMTIVIDAIEQQRNYTATELTDLQTIANAGTSAASIQANAILHRLNGELYHPPIRKIGTSAAKRTLTDNNKSALVQIYPNPAKDRLYLETNLSVNGQVYFYNSMGQMQQKLSIVAELQKTDIDVHNWQSGVYYYILYTDEGDNHLGKFIIH